MKRKIKVHGYRYKKKGKTVHVHSYKRKIKRYTIGKRWMPDRESKTAQDAYTLAELLDGLR